jgi:hypothetical protein
MKTLCLTLGLRVTLHQLPLGVGFTNVLATKYIDFSSEIVSRGKSATTFSKPSIAGT